MSAESRFERMDQQDLTHPDSVFQEPFREYLRREGRTYSGDYVPVWFLRRVARHRLRAAQHVVEALKPPPSHNLDSAYAAALWDALETVHRCMQDDYVDPLDLQQQVLLALLGGAEYVEARNRRWQT